LTELIPRWLLLLLLLLQDRGHGAVTVTAMVAGLPAIGNT
jgi:cell shape-determining protein MreD